MISCFMVVKDVLKPGYPFVEAIASVLPICDEFLLSEGYSKDGTYEVVQELAKLNQKIKVVRQKWPEKRSITVIGDVTNAIRTKCKGDYIFSVQANEIVHEDSLKLIEALPEICPQAQTFSFPYVHLYRTYKFSEEFRLRFARNLPSIVATGDAWTLGPSKDFIMSETLRSLRNPRKILRYVSRGIEWTYANSCGNIISRAIYLPKPVFRYWSLFPVNWFEKATRHAEMFNIPSFREVVETLRNHVDDYPSVFFRMAVPSARKGSLGYNYPEALGEVKIEEHPKLIRDLVSDSRVKSYYVRNEVLDLVKGL
jgi:hypothetical protein